MRGCLLGPYKLVFATLKDTVRINDQITAPELRVILDDGETLGVLSQEEALKKAMEKGLDLIEISPKAKPPVAKIMDYGKYQYLEKKKQKEQKAKSHNVEVKNIQVKINTGDHDLALKARNASKWLAEGHRVKVELFLRGRSKYMEEAFHKERLDRVLALIDEEYQIAEPMKKGPKGPALIIERKRGGKKPEQQQKQPQEAAENTDK